MDESFHTASSSAPDPISYCKDVLYEKCPNEVRVDFLVNLEQLKAATKDMIPENEAKIVERVYSFIPRIEREKVGDTPSRENIIQCLLSLITQGFFHKEEVMIASKKLKKNDNVIDEMNKVLQELGLEDHIQGGQGGSEENDLWSWSIDNVLGRNMYSNDAIGVYWRMNLEFHKKANMNDEEKAVAEYQIELKKKRSESSSSDNPKVFVLMKRKGVQKEDNDDSKDDDDIDSDEEEETPVTPENFQPMWLSKIYNEHYDRIGSHFFEGEGETIDIKQRLQKGNTDTGNLRIMMFEKELKHAKKITSPSERLAAIFALTQIGAYDNYWMHDNENPESVQKLVKDLASVWKNDLLKEDNETLGLGLTEGGDSDITDDSPSVSRELLHDHLKLLKNQYECDEDIKFDWEPVSNKKRRRSESSEDKK